MVYTSVSHQCNIYVYIYIYIGQYSGYSIHTLYTTEVFMRLSPSYDSQDPRKKHNPLKFHSNSLFSMFSSHGFPIVPFTFSTCIQYVLIQIAIFRANLMDLMSFLVVNLSSSQRFSEFDVGQSETERWWCTPVLPWKIYENYRMGPHSDVNVGL